MKNAQRPDHISLGSLLIWLREGKFVIPDFQREFEWQPWDIRDLVRSIFLDYYIGSLLLLKGKKDTFETLSCEPIYGREDLKYPDQIVLDGQQRLTAINYAFTSTERKLPNRSAKAFYWVHVTNFVSQNYDDAFHYRWDSRYAKRLFSQRELQYEEHVFPCTVIGEGGFEIFNWVKGYETFWLNRAEALTGTDELGATEARQRSLDASVFGEHVHSMVTQYQISYNELDRDLEIDKVCDIFTQLNSKGVQLDIFDLMNALLKPKGLQLKYLWRDASERLAFVESNKMNVYVLQVMSILAQDYCSPKYLYYLLPQQTKVVRDPDGTRREERLVLDTDDFLARWTAAVNAMARAIDTLKHPQEFGAVAPRFFPYVSILPVFAALRYHLETGPSALKFSGQKKIRHWYWASVFDNRYSGSVESTSAQDYRDIRKWITDDAYKPTWIRDFEHRLGGIDLHGTVNSGSSIYKGIFNMFILEGARDWLTGDIPPYDDVDDHHIVPTSWEVTKSRPGEIHTILNRSPLTSSTNRQIIRDRLPNEYLPELIARNGEKVVRSTLQSHYITSEAIDILLRNPFTLNDYHEFLAERKRAVVDVIQRLVSDERLDLSPALADLDQDIEDIELGLRRLIASTLEFNRELLPDPVRVKVKERLETESRRDPLFDRDKSESLAGMLEFADLRDLESTIVNKANWEKFQPCFSVKELLAGKFNQLAGLRNAIRHSRSVNQVTQKEGEAAITWFGQILQKANDV